MASNIDAIIAALRVALKEAETGHGFYWEVQAVNRWIDQLPGAWMGRWRHLKLMGDSGGYALRDQFMGHVRATIAYLEVNRDAIAAQRAWSWAMSSASRPGPADPIDADFKEVSESDTRPVKNSRRSMRLIKR